MCDTCTTVIRTTKQVIQTNASVCSYYIAPSQGNYVPYSELMKERRGIVIGDSSSLLGVTSWRWLHAGGRGWIEAQV